MNTERWILIGIIFATTFASWKLIPREKARDALVLFLFLQIITWPSGLFAVEMKWIEYPVQIFPQENNINKSSFFFEFFLFPLFAVIFSLHFPKNATKIGAFVYYCIFAGLFTGLEVILEQTTKLVEYHRWKWYWTLVTLMISLYLNHKYYFWFRKKLIKVGVK
jgi:hypothetical protein